MSEAEKTQMKSLETTSKTSSRSLVLLEKINENLESLLKAFEGRITNKTILPSNLQEYPNPIQEGHRLAKHMKLIKDTQTQWESPPVVISRELHMKDMLETIDENNSLHVKPEDQIVLDNESNHTSEIHLAFRDVNHQELWDEIRDMK